MWKRNGGSEARLAMRNFLLFQRLLPSSLRTTARKCIAKTDLAAAKDESIVVGKQKLDAMQFENGFSLFLLDLHR